MQVSFKSVEKVSTPFEAVKLSYVTYPNAKDSFTLIGLKFLEVNKALKTLVNKLAKEGTSESKLELSMTKNEKGFFSLTDAKEIEKFEDKPKKTTSDFKKFGSSFGSVSSIAGQIKGNVVSNAVALAIARGDTTFEGMKTASSDVIALHKHLESLDIAKLVGLEKDKAKTEAKAEVDSVDLDALLAEEPKSKDLI